MFLRITPLIALAAALGAFASPLTLEKRAIDSGSWPRLFMLVLDGLAMIFTELFDELAFYFKCKNFVFCILRL